ncbi:MAG: flagellar basal body rod protein FlgB [Vulcanimicrobiota bacterium]
MRENFLSTSDNLSLKRMLDVSEIRHKYISNNIANLDTPGYRSKDLDFRGILRNAKDPEMRGVSKTDNRHFPVGKTLEESPFHLEGEFTKLFINYKQTTEEEEMSKLASNGIAYRAASELLSRKFQLLSNSIVGGR